ncbi:hypothetical protein IPJ72_00845 [Candidatus Peregrinibacteria bacterium]|nr:MAG: hypothetical protein IPJ72_00845 [Candidatus Peregrinibacteria bacterium]
MSEVGGLDFFDAPQAAEANEVSDEQIREEARRSQAARAQLQKDEGKAKKNDHTLAQIIVQFLGQPQNTDLFLLISRVIAHDVPSELIVAILSLIDEAARTQVVGLLAAPEATVDAAPAGNASAGFQSLSADQRARMDDWLTHMRMIALQKPHKTLDSMLMKTTDRPLSPALIQLSAFVLRRYFESNQISMEFEHLYDFMQDVFVKIAKELANLISGQRKLA